MKERLTNNLGLKVLAIFLAFFVWLIVSNVSNPLISDQQEVVVEIRNEGVLEKSNLTYELLGKNTVTVNYKVYTLDRYKIKSGDFKAYADLSELYDVTGSIPIRVEVVNNRSIITEVVNTTPGVLQVKTEELQRKPFELQVHTVGETEEGYEPGNIKLTPEYIYVTGAVSVVGKISSVGVKIEIGGANADFTGVGEPIFYDANDNELPDIKEDVTLNTSEINYQVTVLKVKNLGLDFQVEGTVADGYRFTGVESDIKSVSVMGMKSTLASLSTLTIPSEYLNLSGATRDVVVNVDLSKLLPENITMAGEDGNIATITLKIEPLETRGFKVSSKDIELVGAVEGTEYEFDKETLQVDIQGLSEDLDTLHIEDLKPSVDVSDMEDGEHSAVLKLESRDGFDMTSYEEFTITVKSEPEDEETESKSSAHETSKTAES